MVSGEGELNRRNEVANLSKSRPLGGEICLFTFKRN